MLDDAAYSDMMVGHLAMGTAGKPYCWACYRLGPVENAHVTPRSRGGTETIPLCHGCHRVAPDIADDGSAFWAWVERKAADRAVRWVRTIREAIESLKLAGYEDPDIERLNATPDLLARAIEILSERAVIHFGEGMFSGGSLAWAMMEVDRAR